MERVNIYYDQDADVSVLEGKTIAVIGYGNQGRAQALNLRDSAVGKVIVGNIKDESWKQAEKDGFKVLPISDAAKEGDILFILLPDEVAAEIFKSDIIDNLDGGDVLNFSSGYNITYGFIQPPQEVDIIMIAPRMIGAMVRKLYKRGEGFPSILVVEQDYSGQAKSIALAIAKAIGSTKSGAIEGTMDMETKTDLLTEQGLLPIMLNAMIAKYEIEKELGIPPEIILTELYLSKEMSYVFEEIARKGILGQLPEHSRTSQYGQLSRTEEFDYSTVKSFMEDQMKKIDDGSFAREWKTEQVVGDPVFKRLYNKFRQSKFVKDEQITMEKLGLKEQDE